MGLWEKIAEQFRHPTGFLGNIAGFIMANRSSNIERNNWAISMLNIKPSDHILEIGFGPGVAIQKMSEIVSEGIIYGIDHSELMLKQASKRNMDAVSAGRVRLSLASVSELPSFDEPVDKILDINTFQFWDNRIDSLRKVRNLLRPEGIIAIVHQPRKPGAKEKDSTEAGEQFSEYLKKAGFKDIRIEKKMMKPVPTVCVLGKNVE